MSVKITKEQFDRLLEYAKYELKCPCNSSKCVIRCSLGCVEKREFDTKRTNKFQYTEDLIKKDKDIRILELKMEELFHKEKQLKELQKEIKGLQSDINKRKKQLLEEEDNSD